MGGSTCGYDRAVASAVQNASTMPGKTTTETIQAITIIDKATGWPEFVGPNRNKTFYHISILFDSEWLCRYP
jgi:hypothetical protein